MKTECQRFLTHQQLLAIVHGGDLAYIDGLLKSFLERTKLYPEALFKQIFALEAGTTSGAKVRNESHGIFMLSGILARGFGFTRQNRAMRR